MDTAHLHRTFIQATPFPHVVIENSLEPEAARAVAEAYPTFEDVRRLGFSFNAVNERKKMQVTDRSRFPEPVGRLADYLGRKRNAEAAAIAELNFIRILCVLCELCVHLESASSSTACETVR